MKTRKLSVLVLGFLASVFALTSCDMDSDNYNVQRPTALVTVYPVTSESFRMQLDDQTVLFPTNMKASPFGDKKVRALVSYEYEEGANLNSALRNVRVNWIDSIRTKQPVVSKGSDDEKLYGNDGVEIVRDWVTVAEDGYLTLRLRTIWGGGKHIINLVGGVNKDNVYEFDLRHNAQGDISGVLGDALIAFDLNSMWPDHPEEVKIKLNWKSFSGKKSMEFPLKMHSDKSVIVTGDIAKSRFVD